MSVSGLKFVKFSGFSYVQSFFLSALFAHFQYSQVIVIFLLSLLLSVVVVVVVNVNEIVLAGKDKYVNAANIYNGSDVTRNGEG